MKKLTILQVVQLVEALGLASNVDNPEVNRIQNLLLEKEDEVKELAARYGQMTHPNFMGEMGKLSEEFNKLEKELEEAKSLTGLIKAKAQELFPDEKFDHTKDKLIWRQQVKACKEMFGVEELTLIPYQKSQTVSVFAENVLVAEWPFAQSNSAFFNKISVEIFGKQDSVNDGINGVHKVDYKAD